MAKDYTMKDLVDAALRRYNFDASITRQQVVEAYNHVVGDFIVKLTRSVVYDAHSHTLRVTFSASALKQELSYKTTDLINAINKHLGTNEVQHIVFM